MRLIKLAREKGLIQLMPETTDDLWHLERIIEPSDLVSGSTTRKIKGQEGEQTKRQKMFIKLRVQEVEFDEFSSILRVHGLIEGGKPEEFIELGAAHSLSIEPGFLLKIEKENLSKRHIERLKKAEKATHSKPVLCVLIDDERADFFELRAFKTQRKGSIKSGKSGKLFEAGNWQKEFFSKVLAKIKEQNIEQVLIAGPGFTKNDFHEFLKEKDFNGKVFIEGTNSVGITGLNELLKGKRTSKIMEKLQIAMDARLMNELLAEIGKGHLAEYGPEQVKKAIQMGSVKKLILLDKFFLKNRSEWEELMQLVERSRGEIHIIDSNSSAGKELEGIGMVAALLRFKIN